MGNFEKLGILVIIVLVVVIIVVAAWGVKPGTPAHEGSEASLVAHSNPNGGADDRALGEEGEEEGEEQGYRNLEPPPPPPPPPPPVPESRIHEVQRGDVLVRIAERYYGPGKGHLWRKIAAANPDVDPGRLMPGMKLKIPALETGSGGRRPEVVEAPGGRTCKVLPGDSLWLIAKRELDDPMRYKEILALNPDVDAGRLRIGQVLRLPER